MSIASACKCRLIPILAACATALGEPAMAVDVNSKLGGASLKSTGGGADVILAAPIWFGNNAQSATYFAITPYLFVPVGSYKIGDPLNLGENLWKFDLQASLARGLSPDILLQVTGSVMWYDTNSDAVGRGIGRLEQDNTYQLQTWLSYHLPVRQDMARRGRIFEVLGRPAETERRPDRHGYGTRPDLFRAVQVRDAGLLDPRIDPA
ncbi:transporter [Methylobacterium sp. E-045]|uniref:transporter n=1 Tax=Methylobacterium sp. E-045 TaxID=2836575 RepID=UPI001FB8B01B|nr:transporter [Methylobacterium sp. E-045]MCJ2128209.1 transporter [Methylobacterium sp. E-045]